MGPLHLHQLLPMVLLGPFTFSRGIANALGWAYHIGAAVAGHGIALAHYFSGGCCQCPRVGPLHWQELLPMGSLWPIMFLADAANGFAWANLFFRRYFRYSRVGPLQ